MVPALVVDDSRAMRTILARMLQELGFTPTCLADPREAVAEVTLRPPAVILVDWSMPGMSGPALVEQLRRVPPAASCRILLMGRNGPGCLQAWRAAGADGFLPKPVRPQVLERTVGRPRSPV